MKKLLFLICAAITLNSSAASYEVDIFLARGSLASRVYYGLNSTIYAMVKINAPKEAYLSVLKDAETGEFFAKVVTKKMNTHVVKFKASNVAYKKHLFTKGEKIDHKNPDILQLTNIEKIDIPTGLDEDDREEYIDNLEKTSYEYNKGRFIKDKVGHGEWRRKQFPDFPILLKHLEKEHKYYTFLLKELVAIVNKYYSKYKTELKPKDFSKIVKEQITAETP